MSEFPRNAKEVTLPEIESACDRCLRRNAACVSRAGPCTTCLSQKARCAYGGVERTLDLTSDKPLDEEHTAEIIGPPAGETSKSAWETEETLLRQAYELQAGFADKAPNMGFSSASGTTYLWQRPDLWHAAASSAAACFVGEWGPGTLRADDSGAARILSVADDNAAVSQPNNFTSPAAEGSPPASISQHEIAFQVASPPRITPSAGSPELVLAPSDALLTNTEPELVIVPGWVQQEMADPTLPTMEIKSDEDWCHL